MQTILTVAHAATHSPRMENEVNVSRAAYSIDGYSPVMVTIRVFTQFATVHTTCLPGGSWWRVPDAATRRRLLDEVLADTGLVRSGPVETRTADDWFHRYPLRAL